jgi:hypothetical protein
MLNIPTDRSMFSDGYAPHKYMKEFVDNDVFTELQTSWPDASLFKDDGNVKPRKHGQRPHLRKLMCYAVTPQSSYFDPYMVELSSLPTIWRDFAFHVMHSKEYREFIGDCFQIKNFNMRFDWHLTGSGKDVSPHVDSLGKEGSHLMYFMPDGWTDDMGGQTVFYKYKLIAANNPEADDFKDKVMYKNTGNTSLLFKNQEGGWHGVTEVNSTLDRQIFNVVILKA